jgi:hypothetical protein
MKSVRVLSRFLYYLSRGAAILYIVTTLYAMLVMVLFSLFPGANIPMSIRETGIFQITYPFTSEVFLQGEYTTSYLSVYFLILSFYGLFLWLLGDVFRAFRQARLFTQKGFVQLSRFYIVNITIPVLILVLLAIFQQELSDILRITFLHLVIGVFAFFMAAIFKQGLALQEEQDLIF